MKNEALETYCINNVELWLCPKEAKQETFHSNRDIFYCSNASYDLSRAKSTEGDIYGLLKKNDGVERFSIADQNNLKSRETIELELDHVNLHSKLGLVLHFRQSLMTTYLFYSMIGYMGDQASDFLTKLNQDSSIRSKFKNGFHKELGDIDVYVWDSLHGKWKFIDGFNETGPIAINKQIMPIVEDNPSSSVRIKMVLNRGLWRTDLAKLVGIENEVEPIKIKPNLVLNKGREDLMALERLSDKDSYLISMSGSEYQLNFNIPEALGSCDYFLFAKGYYLEWMREHWLQDKNM